mmetsp:Transcript_1217/g.3899  ORF Transcript_1217/g.3899 Transcript_1217/m.3899 type:complete len:266 (-) Transcript_1217:148-945(-)
MDVAVVVELPLDPQKQRVAPEVIKLVDVDPAPPVGDDLVQEGLLDGPPLHHVRPLLSEGLALQQLLQLLLRGVDELLDEFEVVALRVVPEANLTQWLLELGKEDVQQPERRNLVGPRLVPPDLLLGLSRQHRASVRQRRLRGPPPLTAELVEEDLEHVTVTGVPQVMAEGRQHRADGLAVGDAQLRLALAEALDQLVPQEGAADAVEEAVVGGAGVDQDANAQLLDVAHALKDVCVHDGAYDPGQVDQPMHGIIRCERLLQQRVR